ncbi:ribonuclease H2 subunit B [Phlebotomus argentipes]|uniref:ribonuclease H2 subunit B n=1 Tax=Phlebotomus argentipes TaxID=94469 RepID=UPI0028937F1B|nr:ribonuclease H2 subunit B [Phlebotomus argentipes]
MSKSRGAKGRGNKKESAETCEVFTRPKGETRVCFLDKKLFEVKDGQLDVISLRNPSSLKAANYIISTDGKCIRELLQFCQPYRSWFIDESIQADGNLYITTEIDPLFLILPYLVDACSEMAAPLDSFLVDEEFPHISRLQEIVTAKQMTRISDEKGNDFVKGFKYNEIKTLDWLSQKCQRVAKVLKEKKIFVGQGAVSATFISPDASGETEDDTSYLTYAFTILSDYISEDLSALLKQKLGIEEKSVANVKRKPSKTLQDASGKKIKTENDENQYAESDLVQEKVPEVKLTSKEKALAKAATGTKSIMSFFKKK